MKKSSLAVSLALLSPALLVSGCNNRSEEEDDDRTTGGRSYYPRGGAAAERAATNGSAADSASHPRGGFGSSGRSFSGGG